MNKTCPKCGECLKSTTVGMRCPNLCDADKPPLTVQDVADAIKEMKDATKVKGVDLASGLSSSMSMSMAIYEIDGQKYAVDITGFKINMFDAGIFKPPPAPEPSKCFPGKSLAAFCPNISAGMFGPTPFDEDLEVCKTMDQLPPDLRTVRLAQLMRLQYRCFDRSINNLANHHGMRRRF